MEKCREFSLIGYGYVQDLDLTGDVATLRLQVASLSPDAQESVKDRIMIHCTTTCPRLRRRLTMLDSQHPAIAGITAWFQVRYVRTESIHPHVTPGHSAYRLKFSGELTAIENWLRDGTQSFLK